MTLEQLHQVADGLRKLDPNLDVEVRIEEPNNQFWTKNDYLLSLFDTRWEDGNALVLMGDMGVTYEPWKPYSTPCYCLIREIGVDATVQKLHRLWLAYNAGKLKEEGSGENI